MLSEKRLDLIKKFAYEVTKDGVSTQYSLVNKYDEFTRTKDGLKLTSYNVYSGSKYREIESLEQREILYFLEGYRHYLRYTVLNMGY